MEGRIVCWRRKLGRLACRQTDELAVLPDDGRDSNRCLDVMSARQVKHDCRYPGTAPLQIRWTAVYVVEPWRACFDRPTRYERNHRRTGPVQNNL